MFVDPSVVWSFIGLFALFGGACFMAGRAWGIDTGREREALIRDARPAAPAEPRQLARPVPAAPPWWAGHAAPAGERRAPCSPEVERQQRQMAALTAETMNAFDAIQVELRATLAPVQLEPTAPISARPRFIPSEVLPPDAPRWGER